MYAVVSNVRIEDLGTAREALADLRVSLVPRAPEEAVRYPVPPLPGVTLLTVEVREVTASA